MDLVIGQKKLFEIMKLISILIGVTLAVSSALAQEQVDLCIVSDSQCKKIKSSELSAIQSKVEDLISTPSPNGRIIFCSADEKTKKCTDEGVGAFSLAGFVLPGRAALKTANFSKLTEDSKAVFDLTTSNLGIPSICTSASIKVEAKGNSISIYSPPVYCNWIVVGNVFVKFDFLIKSIDPIAGFIYANYNLNLVGTGVGTGSGFSIIKFSSEYAPKFASLFEISSQIATIKSEAKAETTTDNNIDQARKIKELQVESAINSLPLKDKPDLSDNQRLKNQAEEAKRKQLEAEEKLKYFQQQASVNNSSEPFQAPQSSLSVTPNRKALVIGNDSYKSVAKLENAREDARTIASNLMSVGYQVTLKTDLNEKEMKSALRNFASQVQGGDEVMFFFAGHGVQLGAANYLLPTDILGDSEAQVKDEAIQLQRILDDMSERKAKFTLAMIDACRDNPFKSSGRAIGGRGLAPTTAATGQMVIFSAGTGQQALDKLNNADKNKNGLFTRVFVQEMQKPSQSIDRVVKNVRNQVAELAKSVGHEQVPAIYDQVLGDFYFKK